MKTIAILSVSLVVLGAAFSISTVQAAEGRCYQDDEGRIVARRRPGYTEVPCPGSTSSEEAPSGIETPSGTADEARRPTAGSGQAPRAKNPVSPVPRPTIEDYVQAVPLPDRWRIVDTLKGYDYPLWDPYNRNVLKGDKPVNADEWFFTMTGISDSVVEVRDVPTPVGVQSTRDPGSLDVFGSSDQFAYLQTFLTEFIYLKGDTVFRPPDHEFRFTAAWNINYTELDENLGVNVDPRNGDDRTDHHVGIQAAFYDRHLRNVGDRYDFDSFRIGIQPFSSDFRGFLFQDNQLGARLFGTRDNNFFQYNLAWFRRLEKDTNSGLNDVSKSLRDDDVFIANLYWQDMPILGYQSQATVIYNRNREDDFHFDTNDFIVRPASLGQERTRDYDVVYLGYNGDGHFGRLNLTNSFYYAVGKTDPGNFLNDDVDISAFFAATELSMDFDWIRWRFSFLYGSGDDDPYDDEANGFDAIFENPQFAGADTSYWIRQAVPLIGGGRVALSGRNGVLNSMRSSKDQGQSNFTNPGIWLVGLGGDLDITPELRLSFNWNELWFDETEVLEAARNQGPIDDKIGRDISVSATWRPFMSQNVVVRASYAKLFADDGFEDLFPSEDPGYFFLNAVLTF